MYALAASLLVVVSLPLSYNVIETGGMLFPFSLAPGAFFATLASSSKTKERITNPRLAVLCCTYFCFSTLAGYCIKFGNANILYGVFSFVPVLVGVATGFEGKEIVICIVSGCSAILNLK